MESISQPGTVDSASIGEDAGAFPIAQANRAPAYQYVLAFLMAVLGGLLGIMGAIFQEGQTTFGFLLLPFLGAPIIEEALKPSGLYLALLWWPRALNNQLFTAVLCSISGLVFGVIESLVYVTIYVEDPSDSFILYRFTVTLALHAIASFVVGLGINRGILDWAAGRTKLSKSSRNYYIAGVAIHAIYNTSAVILSIAGALDFDEQ
jgi:RsiW-degrading membrane proteinase PrsW (M82 family)